ncbi:MAG: hypothetical protein WBD53_05110 [Xanthobacteraceae bacterium]
MPGASTISPEMRDMTRDTAEQAREGVREANKAASEASGNIQTDLQTDLQALRDDFGRLAEQMADILANRGGAAWQRARSSVDDVVADAQDRGREAVGALREVSDNFVEALDDSIKTRPYVTLAVVAGLAFLFGATWRR